MQNFENLETSLKFNYFNKENKNLDIACFSQNCKVSKTHFDTLPKFNYLDKEKRKWYVTIY